MEEAGKLESGRRRRLEERKRAWPTPARLVRRKGRSEARRGSQSRPPEPLYGHSEDQEARAGPEVLKLGAGWAVVGLEKVDRPYHAQSSRAGLLSPWVSTGLRNHFRSGVAYTGGVSGGDSLARAQRSNLAFGRPLLARFGSCRHLGSAAAAAAGSRIRGNPTRETSVRDVIFIGDATGPPGSAGVPTEEASLELRGTPAQAGKSLGAAACLHCALSAPQVTRGPG